ncbi:MAG: hypothetical protein V1922_03900 [bacterium]
MALLSEITRPDLLTSIVTDARIMANRQHVIDPEKACAVRSLVDSRFIQPWKEAKRRLPYLEHMQLGIYGSFVYGDPSVVPHDIDLAVGVSDELLPHLPEILDRLENEGPSYMRLSMGDKDLVVTTLQNPQPAEIHLADTAEAAVDSTFYHLKWMRNSDIIAASSIEAPNYDYFKYVRPSYYEGMHNEMVTPTKLLDGTLFKGPITKEDVSSTVQRIVYPRHYWEKDGRVHIAVPRLYHSLVAATSTMEGETIWDEAQRRTVASMAHLLKTYYGIHDRDSIFIAFQRAMIKMYPDKYLAKLYSQLP